MIAAFGAAVLMILSLAVPAQAQPSTDAPTALAKLAKSVGATTSPTTPTEIALLGDSYGSGTGGGDYRQGSVGTCWSSLNSAGEVVVRQLKNAGYNVTFSNVACAGAKIKHLYESYHGRVQLNALRQDTRLVLLQIGGNDIETFDVINKCLEPDTTCAGAPIEGAQQKLGKMAEDLYKLFVEIKKRSPRTKIVLLGYGQPMADGPNAPGTPGVELDPICDPKYFSLEERKQGGRLSADLDLTLRSMSLVARATGLPVSFVSPYDSSVPWGTRLDPAFVGRSVCATVIPQQFYHGLLATAPPPPSGPGDLAGGSAVLHGNRAGYEKMAELIITEAPASR